MQEKEYKAIGENQKTETKFSPKNILTITLLSIFAANVFFNLSISTKIQNIQEQIEQQSQQFDD